MPSHHSDWGDSPGPGEGTRTSFSWCTLSQALVERLAVRMLQSEPAMSRAETTGHIVAGMGYTIDPYRYVRRACATAMGNAPKCAPSDVESRTDWRACARDEARA